MGFSRRLTLIAVLSASLAVSLGVASAQNSGGNGGNFVIPGGLVPDDNTTGPVANVGAEYKFDDNFYQRIQDLILEEPQPSDYGVHDGERYYNVIIVVSRDDGDGRDPDETAKENKDSIVRHLNALGARDVIAAESLSFVTASIPVAEIPGISLRGEIYQMGDGEMLITVDVDRARRTIHATSSELRPSTGSAPSGTGVTVAVVDAGINSTYLNSKVVNRVYCDGGCRAQPNGIIVGLNLTHFTIHGQERGYEHVYEQIFASHGTQVAQVLAASGMSSNNGIATGLTLLDAMLGQESGINNSLSSLAHAIDWSYGRGADVVNISANHRTISCSQNPATSYSLIINEAVDKGMVVINSAGNKGVNDASQPAYRSIAPPTCAHNVIAVGGINDRNSNIEMAYFSSRGPISSSDPRLAPHIVAPAYGIQTLDFPNNASMSARSGTSYAAPQVSAAAALLLQASPELTPAEVKATLLLGADWKGPVPCTSAQYEQNNANDNCSYARQPRNYNTANNAASLGILNNVGFGILDVAGSLKYVNTSPAYVISDDLDTDTASKWYQFTADRSDRIKIILTWMAHPHGGIIEQQTRTTTDPVANLDFVVRQPGGGVLLRANSAHQTAEFAVFDAPVSGRYNVTVSGSGLDSVNKPVQTFALASTHQLAHASSNQAPVAKPRTLVVSPGIEAVVRLSATDSDGDPVTFHVSRDPAKGTISTDELITKTVSRAIYTPNLDFAGTDTFEVTPHDGTESGTAATMTLVAESLPPGATAFDVASVDTKDRDTYKVTRGFAHTDYIKEFAGRDHPVSALYVGATNMEGADLKIVTTDQNTYTVAVPLDGVRMIKFASPITIQSAVLSADGINEYAAYVNQRMASAGQQYSSDYKDVSMFVEYVASSCLPATSASVCPAQSAHSVSTQVGLPIPDNTDSQDATSIIHIPERGTITALSVHVDISHPLIDELKVTLTSPDGTVITLHNLDGRQSNINKIYSSSTNAALGGLVGSQLAGRWELSAGDYRHQIAGSLNSWSLSATYNPPASTSSDSSPPITVFSDGFEPDYVLTRWLETGEGDWTTSTTAPRGVPGLPGQSASNRVLHSDDCDTLCTLTLRDPIDLRGYSSATLSLWRFVDSQLDSGEYLKVDLYNGSSWNTVYNWYHGSGDDHRWHKESYDLASYLDSAAFKMRLVTRQSDDDEAVQLDDIMINAILRPTPDHAVSDIQANGRLGVPLLITPDIDDSLTVTAATGATKGTIYTNWLSSGRILYLPGKTGIDTITYTVSDDRGNNANGVITIYTSERGNARPVLGHIHNMGARVGEKFNFTASATDSNGDPLTFDIANAPDGATMGASTGIFSWTPSSSQSGTHTVTITVHDGRGGADWQYVTITVLRSDEINRPPVPENVTDDAVIGELKAIRPRITDPEGDATTIIAVSESALGSVIDTFLSRGLVVYLGSELGSEDITYTVSDGRGGIATGTISITVVEPVNVPPILGHIHDKGISAGRALTFTATAIDVDRPAQTLTFTLDGTVPAGASITPQGAFSWRPTTSQVGSHSLTVAVTDGTGGRDTETFTATVRPSGYVNRPPVASDAIGATSENAQIIIRPTLTDPNGDRVWISETHDTTKGRILSGFLRAGIVLYQPNPGQFGTETATYTAFDGWAGAGASTDTGTITIFINKNGNASPILGTIGPRSVTAGQTLTFTASATDANGNTVSYMLVGAPDGATMSQQGSFRWTPASSDAGSHTFTVVAYDSLGGADTETITVRVL